MNNNNTSNLAIYRNWRTKHCRAEDFDIFTATQFSLLIKAGLREHHRLLELGCDCLGLGRFAIPYLNEERYVGIEVDKEQTALGVIYELGADTVTRKLPRFIYDNASIASLISNAATFSQPFDMVANFNCFGYCSSTQVKHQFKQIANVTNKETVVVGMYYEGYIKPYRYTENEMQRMLDSVGWQYTSSETFYGVPANDSGIGRFFTAQQK